MLGIAVKCALEMIEVKRQIKKQAAKVTKDPSFLKEHVPRGKSQRFSLSRQLTSLKSSFKLESLETEFKKLPKEEKAILDAFSKFLLDHKNDHGLLTKFNYLLMLSQIVPKTFSLQNFKSSFKRLKFRCTRIRNELFLEEFFGKRYGLINPVHTKAINKKLNFLNLLSCLTQLKESTKKSLLVSKRKLLKAFLSQLCLQGELTENGFYRLTRQMLIFFDQDEFELVSHLSLGLFDPKKGNKSSCNSLIEQQRKEREQERKVNLFREAHQKLSLKEYTDIVYICINSFGDSSLKFDDFVDYFSCEWRDIPGTETTQSIFADVFEKKGKTATKVSFRRISAESKLFSIFLPQMIEDEIKNQSRQVYSFLKNMNFSPLPQFMEMISFESSFSPFCKAMSRLILVSQYLEYCLNREIVLLELYKIVRKKETLLRKVDEEILSNSKLNEIQVKQTVGKLYPVAEKVFLKHQGRTNFLN
eukprot:snap_masked-scaffold_11-processed-gene-4.4-mRNA-1 protein AED:0.08 eAED:1.00 QI:0/0/0/1/1/1/2/0/472